MRIRRRWWWWSGLAALALLLGLVGLVWVLDAVWRSPGYQGPPSDHFDGVRFHNRETHPPPPAESSRVSWLLGRLVRPAWDPVTVEPQKPTVHPADTALHVTWVGHSTVLIQVGGIAILTDPIWSERASPVSFVGPRRRSAPGVRFADLPPIRLVLISHDHYDHCDLPTLRRLVEEHHPVIVTGLGVDRLLAAHGIPATAIDWWQTITPLPGIRITGVPAQHFSNRFLSDRNRDLWLGFVVETPAGACYVAGDTGPGTHFADIGRRFPGLRLALLPIGAFRPNWMMAEMHIGPTEALQAMHDLGAGTALGIHWGTFPLADDAPDEPSAGLRTALAADPHPPRFWLFRPGESRAVP